MLLKMISAPLNPISPTFFFLIVNKHVEKWDQVYLDFPKVFY